MIAVVDYGAGNQASVRKALLASGADVYTPTEPSALHTASAIVIPGVGHFAATASLDASWRRAIADAIDAGTPLLGICLGMQWLFDGSDEEPGLAGLGYFAGRVTRLTSGGSASLERVKIPHVGWNVIEVRDHQAFNALHGRYAYFTHAYAAPVTDECVAVTTHGAPFAAATARGNVWGAQFHPEKSGQTGLTLLKAFVELASQ